MNSDNTDLKKSISEDSFDGTRRKKLSRKECSVLLKMYRKGKLPAEYLEKKGVDLSGYRFSYANARLNGLSAFESFYNAIFISALAKFDKSEKKITKELKNTFSHPKGWYKNSFHTWQNNFWSHFLHFLQKIPLFFVRIGTFFRDLPKNIKRYHHNNTVKRDNSYRSFITFCRAVIKLASFILPVIVAFMLGLLIRKELSGDVALKLFINGNYIGNVRSSTDVTNARNSVEDNISAPLGQSFRITDEIDYSFTHGKDLEYLTDSAIYSALYSVACEHITPAYGLYVDGVLVAATENKRAIERVKSDLLDYFKERSSFYSDKENLRVSYTNDIKTEALDFPKEMLIDESTLRKNLGLPPVSGDLSIYAMHYMLQEKHGSKKKDTPGKDITGLEVISTLDDETDVGEATVSSKDAAREVELTLGIALNKEERVEEVIEYETEYVETENYLSGVEVPGSRGENGKRIATYDISYDEDGNETSREFVSEEIITPAVNKIIYIGTRVPSEDETSTVATGSFMIPYDNDLSSSYGMRTISEFDEKSFHNAWDIPGPYGSDIAAADSGVVRQISQTSGYGLFVLIDHENGYETLYAHLSDSCVNEGDRVHKGDIIAKMGNSGHVTGVHVHFEIRKNGVAVDPEDYLGYRPERY